MSFNSRTPGGVRQLRSIYARLHSRFQFTHPGRGATQCWVLASRLYEQFQFTHPGRGATGRFVMLPLSACCFNSRTPGGVRLCTTMRGLQVCAVSIHAPREGCDTSTDLSSSRINGFNSRTPGGVRPKTEHTDSIVLGVSIHAPREGCDVTTL